MKRVHLAVLPALLLFAFAGCSPRLNDEKSVELTHDMVQKYILPSAYKEVTVTFESDKEPISVYIVDSAHEAREVENLSKGMQPSLTLGKKEKTKKDEIKLTLPEKKLMTVLLVCEKKTQVKVKMTGK